MRVSQKFLTLCLSILICHLFMPMQNVRGQTATKNQPQLIVQLGHGTLLSSVAFSPDGRFVLTGSEDGTAILWEILRGREVRRFEGHMDNVRSVAFSPDGRFVLTGSNDKTARLWDTATGREVRRFEGHIGDVSSVAFSPDGRFVLTGSNDKTARLWDTATGREVKRFDGIVSPVALSPDGHFVLAVSGTGDRSVRLLETSSGREVSRFEGGSGWIISIAFSPDGRFVLTGGDYTARLWEAATGREIRRFEGHTNGHINSARKVAFSPDGRFVFTGGYDSTAWLWETATGREVQQFKREGLWGFSSIAFSPDGRFVLTGDDFGSTARLWETGTGHEVQQFHGQAYRVPSIAFSPDGRFVLTGSWDGLAHLRDASTGRELRQFVGHTGQVFSVAFSPDGRFVLTGSNDKTARLWETATGHEVQRFKKDDLLGVTSIAFSPDGRFVLTGSYDDNTRLWEVSTGQMVRQITKSTNELAFVPTRTIAFSPVAFSPDGRFVLTGGKSYETAAWLWDTATGRELRQFVGHTEPVDSVAFSPDGRFVLTGSYDKSARLWETATGSEIQRFEGHTGIVDSVAFSPDGSYVLTGSQDTTARLWETATGREVKRFEGNMSIVDSIAFSPDGQLVLSASADGTVKLWDKERGLEICRLLSFLNGTWAVITPDGRFDTNNLEEFLGMYWVMPDDPFRPLPPEIFMRDYYEPQLLPKVLSGKEFKPIRPLAELNRVQPGVKILKVEKGATPDIAKVTVEVSGAEGTFQREGKDVVMKTGVHDLRLYRNGQLVGQWPEAGELTYKSLNTTSEEELNAWRKATEIPLDPSSKATKTFTVRLPRREDLKEVAFSTYAFNLDRVKSETARQKYKVPEKLKQVKGRAYVITVGVSGNEDLLWQLIFASEDAKLIQRAVVKKLEDSKRYEKVVPVCLITTPPGSEEPEAQAECNEFIRPTKENIKTVLDILAGRTVEAARLEQLPPKLRPELRQVQPEDLVLLSFSSHGLTDINGEFYLLPYDLGMDSAGKVTPELLRRSISSQELSLWLSPIDAEQLMMVVDACHSAAAVEAEGFKPGPMGNPGLGQLSYDKGMPILVATQASASAWAERYSLLTLALAQEGIGEKHLELTEALRYAEQRVPKLYEEKIGKEETKKIQVPKLFEFRHP